jgi:hypothetical protein
VREFLQGSGVKIAAPQTRDLAGDELSSIIVEGTYLLTCWMTGEEAARLRAR